MGTGERCVTTEINFDRGRKPAQVIVRLSQWQQEGCFGQIQFPRYRLQPHIRLRVAEQTYRRWVAGKGLLCKSIHCKNLHRSLPQRYRGG